MSFEIRGTGSSFPPQVVDNGMVMEWIHKHYAESENSIWELETCERIYGVKSRCWALDYETGETLRDYIDVNLTLDAAQKALAEAETDPSELDMIIHTSASPEQIVDPDSALLLHRKLGCGPRCSAFMITTTCTGFTEALLMAVNHIRAGAAKNILVTSSNSTSVVPKLNWHMRFFEGDGAAAAVVGEGDSALICGHCGTYSHLESPAHLHYNTIGESPGDGRLVIGFDPHHLSNGVPVMVDIISEINEAMAPTGRDVDMAISHQATPVLRRIISKKMGIDKERVPFDVLIHHGNTFNASTGICLDRERRTLKKKDILAMVAVGVGWRSAHCVIRL